MALLMVLGILMILVGGLMFLIAAFGVSVWWGIFCIIFPPTNFLFLLVNWQVAKRGFLVQLAGVLLIIASVFVMNDFNSLIPNKQMMNVQQFSWSSSNAAALPSSSTGIRTCLDKDGHTIYTNQPCLTTESNVVGPQATDGLPVLPETKKNDTTTSNQPSANNQFHCDGRVTCSQMTSCAEAVFFIKNCPGTKMDGNGDGVPCERQWCGSGI